MNIRRSRVEDREQLLALWERSVRASHHFLRESDVAALRPLVAQELAHDAIQWWVLASADCAPIGFLGYSHATIEALFLDPDHVGAGGGTLLVAHAQQLAGSALTVDVNEQNESARRFYSARGFSVVGRSETDAGGRPFPILHMRRVAPGA
jgi:putative acetyltransferase